MFTVMGDVPLTGDYPQATAVSDVTASGLIRLMSGFNEGVDGNGRSIDEPTSFFIGAALNFNALDLDRELRVLERKVEAGAHFLLSQPVYDPEAVERVAAALGGFPCGEGLAGSFAAALGQAEGDRAKPRRVDHAGQRANRLAGIVDELSSDGQVGVQAVAN